MGGDFSKHLAVITVYTAMNSSEKPKISVFWFRRDLRLEDNAGLYHALKSGNPVLPIFIFDRNILDKLDEKRDRRVTFIHQTLQEINSELKKLNSGLKCFYTTPEDAFEQLLKEFEISAVYTNHDYERYAIDRDKSISKLLKKNNIEFHTFKDQVIFEKDEVLSGSGSPYTVFTPYSNRWKALVNDFYLKPYPTKRYFKNLYKWKGEPMPSLKSMGFQSLDDYLPGKKVSDDLIKHYDERRNFPAIPGTSHLSVHLRFGTVSIRALAARAQKLNNQWLNELIWRDFYMQILWHFPHINEGKSFKTNYDRILWRNNEHEFQLWCEGKTGYPIVDAGMRELNTTGFMHNRVRMITASFLVKHLLIDWRWGEAYFAEKLLDFDFSANNGGWQWAAGSGCDAAPYFRVFNPTLQTERFDKQWEYIKKWVPEYNDLVYLQNPIVNHEFARKRVLEVYKKALAAS